MTGRGRHYYETGFRRFSKNLGATQNSMFQKDWHEASSITEDPQILGATLECSSPSGLEPGISATLSQGITVTVFFSVGTEENHKKLLIIFCLFLQLWLSGFDAYADCIIRRYSEF
jgi:hypothetical protein